MSRRALLRPTAVLGASLCAVLAAPRSGVAQASRETWQPPEQIMDAVGVEPGMRIGEAGAGTGYLTFHLASRVGSAGLVYANEISASRLDVIKARAAREGVRNIRTVLGEVEDPLFPEKGLDMVIMVYVLHFLDKPIEFMQNVPKYLAAGASLVVIELDTHEERAHPPSFMSKRQILETMGETSFRLERTEDFLPRDTIYVYSVRD